jgi:penicillin amidase
MTSAKVWPRRLLAAAGILLACAAALAAVAGLWLRARMSASLPRLDGEVRVPGLEAPVRVTRDALGVPTVTGMSRIDVARATGWLHGQDRFFQMDILRRRGAGELSELFGSATLQADRQARVHGFRRIAREVLSRETPARLALIQAYSDGVNAGLAALAGKPWEYSVLGVGARPWSPEDSVLVNFAMTLDLEEDTGRFVRSLASIRDELGPASLAFFAPLSTAADAALDGSVGAAPPPPPASEVDLRAQEPAPTTGTGPPAWGDRETPGSCAMAVSGAMSAGGGALLANDMHLHLAVPNTWYRISMRWPGHEETGVTVAGTPLLVAGSTGKVAWGFTVSYAGIGDILVVDPSIAPDLYHGPGGGEKGDLVRYEHRVESVGVRGSKPVSMDFKWTVWGPVVDEGQNGHPLVFHWEADDPAATNFGLVELEDATSVQDAVEIAHRAGIPSLNVIVADARGQIAWTIAGRVPRRVGYDGRLPVTWHFGDRNWDGFLASADVPSVISPASGILWSANNREVGGKSLQLLGDGGYDLPDRASQVRDDLAALASSGRPVEPADLLGVQLDNRALYLAHWHDLLLRTLTPDVVSRGVGRAALLDGARNWEGRAAVDSTSYRIVRSFRLAVAHRVLDPIFAPCVERYPGFQWNRLSYEQPLETLLRTRPANLLDPAFHTWDELLVAAADDVSAAYAKQGLDPRKATWGERNTARIGHPFTNFLPRWASGWLSMPRDELPGDSHVPRVLDTDFGASERFVVSPGHEASGIFHMPGGQVSNPLSPFFRAGHEAWVRGDPTPFLPGSTEHTLTLSP